ncbi:hypothetical protein RRSWK_00484 [Rhodopirellula sp. SWK7]|nr:hypothetical protein RRSWK_00484 [Rhodopirellula sp. SWK7]
MECEFRSRGGLSQRGCLAMLRRHGRFGISNGAKRFVKASNERLTNQSLVAVWGWCGSNCHATHDPCLGVV